MNFLSNVLDSIPVVGHVKGVIHYAAGDTEGGKKAMYQSTRTSAVLGGGAVGCLAGPGGAVLGAMYAGLATDGVASIAMNESQGIFKGVDNIADDVKEGKNPTGSILSTGFQLGMDAVGGLGMGGVSSAASQVSEKAVAKTVENVAKKAVASVGEKAIQKTAKVTGEEVVKMVTKTVSEKAVKKVIETAAIQAEVVLVSTHVAMQAKERTKEEERERQDRERRAREEREQQDRERSAREERERQDRERRAREERERQDRERRAREEREQQDRERSAREESERRDREEREREDEERKNNQSGQEKVEFFAIFMDLLNSLLDLIFGSADTGIKRDILKIFTNLKKKQIDYLSSIIERLKNCEILEEVVKLVIKIFSEHFPRNISFQNFLSLLEFVATYITDEISYRTVLYKMAEKIDRQRDRSIPKIEPEVLRADILSELMNLENIVQIIADLFETLRVDIESETAGTRAISPDFRDKFAAVYHYFKHRCVPGDGVLSVREYYDWIRLLQRELGRRDIYTVRVERQRTGTVRGTIVCDMYVSRYGRRVRIVVKFIGRTTVLASCFVVEIIFADDDKDGVVTVKFYL